MVCQATNTPLTESEYFMNASVVLTEVGSSFAINDALKPKSIHRK